MKELSISKGGDALTWSWLDELREIRREGLLSPWNFWHDLWEIQKCDLLVGKVNASSYCCENWCSKDQ